MTELEQPPQALAVPEPHSSALVPGFLSLGFRVRQVVGDSVDLMLDGVRELKRLQLVAQRIIEHGTLIATLEIVTDDQSGSSFLPLKSRNNFDHSPADRHINPCCWVIHNKKNGIENK